MHDLDLIDWRGCACVECVPGKLRSRHVIRGTAIEPAVVLIDEDLGRTPEQTHASFPSLPVETIRAIRTFARHSGYRDYMSIAERLRRFLRI